MIGRLEVKTSLQRAYLGQTGVVATISTVSSSIVSVQCLQTNRTAPANDVPKGIDPREVFLVCLARDQMNEWCQVFQRHMKLIGELNSINIS